MKPTLLSLLALLLAGLAGRPAQAQSTNPRPYCVATFDSVVARDDSPLITNVQIGGLDNSTRDVPFAAGNYVYFDNLPALQLIRGSQVSLSVGVRAPGLAHFLAVYIDYNQDGDFSDRTERILHRSFSQIRDLNQQDFTVSIGGAIGTTRMRVIVLQDTAYAAANADASSCTGYGARHLARGEAEDYTVLIRNGFVPSPNPEFTVDRRRGTTQDIFRFNDVSDANPNFHSWTFTPRNIEYQAGTDSLSASPRVRFTVPGFYTVKLVTGNNSGLDSVTTPNWIEVTEAPAALADQLSPTPTLAWPNPAHGSLTLSPATQGHPLLLLDATGKTVLSIKQAPARLSLTGLPPGLYTLRVYYKNQIHKQILVIT